MIKKTLVLFGSIVMMGAGVSAFAGAECCQPPTSPRSAAVKSEVSPTRALLVSYEKISDALASDNLKAAQKSAKEFASNCQVACDAAETGKKMEACQESMTAFLGEKDIEKARQHFKVISAQVIKMAGKEEGFRVINCPMAGKNADWVQSAKEIRNPYHGSRMLNCGVEKKI